MEQYRGYEIKVIENYEKDYPYKAIARKGDRKLNIRDRVRCKQLILLKKVLMSL